VKRVNPFDVGREQANYHFHLARYLFVTRQLRGDERVLDVGCGVGYGTRLLADHAAEVVGTDAEISLREFWDRFDAPNLSFVEELPSDRYDVVVSFEVIEHVPEDEANGFLVGIKACLAE